MSRRLSDCSCAWRIEHRVPVMSVRESSCPQHGDDADWWERIQAHARTLQANQ